jgi:hypothetical protein
MNRRLTLLGGFDLARRGMVSTRSSQQGHVDRIGLCDHFETALRKNAAQLPSGSGVIVTAVIPSIIGCPMQDPRQNRPKLEIMRSN